MIKNLKMQTIKPIELGHKLQIVGPYLKTAFNELIKLDGIVFDIERKGLTTQYYIINKQYPCAHQQISLPSDLEETVTLLNILLPYTTQGCRLATGEFIKADHIYIRKTSVKQIRVESTPLVSDEFLVEILSDGTWY